MTRRGRSSGRIAMALLACFGSGAIVGWHLHAGAPMPSEPLPPPVDRPAAVAAGASAGEEGVRADATSVAAAQPDAVAALRQHELSVPVEGINVESMRGGFAERRDAGGRPHEAVDMLAPRNTPVHAVENGTIAKLFFSKAGGHTVYQFDPSQRFCYYYAHLERYAPDLREGAAVARGDVIAFVGTSGNSPPNTPHLHFAIFELTPEHHWWQGTALDPYLVFRH
jgi:murein DD-endopeptidase MepM/ murein hydrolase activator NlpD